LKQKNAPPSVDVPKIVTGWLKSRIRGKSISRNTIAVGLVVLDRLRSKSPLSEGDIFSIGGEIKGARSGLPAILDKYGIPRRFLKEATTRQASHDGAKLLMDLKFGKALPASSELRDAQLKTGIELLKQEALGWLAREPIKVSFDRQLSPSTWIISILQKAKGKSGGKVEQHLVGAKLAQRHRSCDVPNFPGHAGDLQTGRSGDFPLKGVSYHVTATDGKEAIPRCKENLESGVHPVLLVPREFVAKALLRAELEGIAARMTVLSIEDFLAQNVIELATESNTDFFTTIKGIIEEYNRRLEKVETDLSLKIEIQ